MTKLKKNAKQSLKSTPNVQGLEMTYMAKKNSDIIA